MGGKELEYVHQAFESNFIAPVGPQLSDFEQRFAT
jgi:dTDP-4-amino-4,6-dideoxygalactose transaminase